MESHKKAAQSLRQSVAATRAILPVSRRGVAVSDDASIYGSGGVEGGGRADQDARGGSAGLCGGAGEEGWEEMVEGGKEVEEEGGGGFGRSCDGQVPSLSLSVSDCSFSFELAQFPPGTR